MAGIQDPKQCEACVHYLNNALVRNAIKAYQQQNKQEEK